MLLYRLCNRCRIRGCGKSCACVCVGWCVWVFFVLMMVLLYCFVVKYGIFAVCMRSWCFVVVIALCSGVECCFV